MLGGLVSRHLELHVLSAEGAALVGVLDQLHDAAGVQEVAIGAQAVDLLVQGRQADRALFGARLLQHGGSCLTGLIGALGA